jgi:hypothetical protein
VRCRAERLDLSDTIRGNLWEVPEAQQRIAVEKHVHVVVERPGRGDDATRSFPSDLVAAD